MNEQTITPAQLKKWQKFLISNPDVKSLYEEEFLDQVHILKTALKNGTLEKIGINKNIATKAYTMGDNLLKYLSGIDKIKIDTSLEINDA